MAKENLEQKINFGSLDLSNLAIQATVSKSLKEGPADPGMIEQAIRSYIQTNSDNSFDKMVLSSVLLGDHEAARANKNGYTISNALQTYFKSMEQGYEGKFAESSFGDINKALASMGYGGEKLAPENMTVREAVEKGDKDIAQFGMAIIGLAKHNLKLGSESMSINGKIKKINERYAPKESKKEN